MQGHTAILQKQQWDGSGLLLPPPEKPRASGLHPPLPHVHFPSEQVCAPRMALWSWELGLETRVSRGLSLCPLELQPDRGGGGQIQGTERHMP